MKISNSVFWPEYWFSSMDIVTSFVDKASLSGSSEEAISDFLVAVRIFWYSTTKLVIGHPPSFQAAKSKIIELEFTFIKWIVDSGASGAEPLVWSDTVSVLSPTPKSFKAYIHLKVFIISMDSATIFLHYYNLYFD